MKKFLISTFLLIPVAILQAQFCTDYCLQFETSECMDQLAIDTSAQNIWQIGIPRKNQIIGGYNSNTAIITDTVNSYPPNNHSVFTIITTATEGDLYGFKTFSGTYYVQTDPLNDYCLLEFSPDRGASWIDLVHDTTYSSSIEWYSPIPEFSGNPGAWQFFDVVLADNGSVFGLEYGDTLYYRFSFFSDSVSDNLDGIAFDNICFWEFVEGISPLKFTPIKSNLFPNPVSENFTIEFENPQHDAFEIAIYDIQSHLIFTIRDILTTTVQISSYSLKPGVYVYKLTQYEKQKRSWGKFVVNR